MSHLAYYFKVTRKHNLIIPRHRSLWLWSNSLGDTNIFAFFTFCKIIQKFKKASFLGWFTSKLSSLKILMKLFYISQFRRIHFNIFFLCSHFSRQLTLFTFTLIFTKMSYYFAKFCKVQYSLRFSGMCVCVWFSLSFSVSNYFLVYSITKTILPRSSPHLVRTFLTSMPLFLLLLGWFGKTRWPPCQLFYLFSHWLSIAD